MTTEKRHRILYIDDDPMNLLLYSRSLRRRGYEVVAVESAESARGEMARQVPDIVLLDIFMPKTSGFELLDEIRSTGRTVSTPVILISALTDANHIVEGLERGANDYVTKPIVLPILAARIDALLRSSELVKKLEVQTELLAKLAAFDELTGVYNRRSLFHAHETELARSQRYGRSMSVLMIDVDHFKSVNDQLGHAAGDAVLREVAAELQGVLRNVDVVCRYGGEEFAAILPETGVDGAMRAAERVRAAVAGRAIFAGEAQVKVTISVGVASWTPDDQAPPPDLISLADMALLEAKAGGRNQVQAKS